MKSALTRRRAGYRSSVLSLTLKTGHLRDDGAAIRSKVRAIGKLTEIYDTARSDIQGIDHMPDIERIFRIDDDRVAIATFSDDEFKRIEVRIEHYGPGEDYLSIDLTRHAGGRFGNQDFLKHAIRGTNLGSHFRPAAPVLADLIARAPFFSAHERMKLVKMAREAVAGIPPKFVPPARRRRA